MDAADKRRRAECCFHNRAQGLPRAEQGLGVSTSTSGHQATEGGVGISRGSITIWEHGGTTITEDRRINNVARIGRELYRAGFRGDPIWLKSRWLMVIGATLATLAKAFKILEGPIVSTTNGPYSIYQSLTSLKI